MVRPINAPFFTPPDGMGGRKPISKTPLVSPEPVAPPQPDPRPPAPPPSGDSGSRKSENKKTPQQAASRQPSRSGFPQDIAWSPEYEPSGIVPYIQAAEAGARDGSEDKTTVVCEALYAADPEGVARGLKFMTGCEPDDEEEVLGECIRLARSVGLDDYLTGEEGWYTTRLGPLPSSADAAFQQDCIDMVFSDDIGILQPGRRIAERALREGASETKDVADSERIDPYAEFRPDPSELNERTVQYLHERFPDVKLRTREDLQAFFPRATGSTRD